MNISRSGYYKWLKTRDVLNRYEINRKDFGKLIIDIHNRKPSYGYHRIRKIILDETGWIVSDNLVHKDKNGNLIKGSGIKSATINFSKITVDGIYKIAGTVIGNAGNKEECYQVVTRDTKKPTISLMEEGTTRSDGYESGLKVIVMCNDETDKIPYQTPDVILNGGGIKTVKATCKDKAGNEVTVDKTYNIYEYSSDTSCGYNSCANSACGTATETRNTGIRHACETYECGTRSCTKTVSDTCSKSIMGTCEKPVYKTCKKIFIILLKKLVQSVHLVQPKIRRRENVNVYHHVIQNQHGMRFRHMIVQQ